MLPTTAPLGRCGICAEPLDPAQQTLYLEQYHETCLPLCTDCRKPLAATSCDLLWRGKNKWFGRHKFPCPSRR